MCLMFGKWNVITEWFLHPDILSDPGDNGAKFGFFFSFLAQRMSERFRS